MEEAPQPRVCGRDNCGRAHYAKDRCRTHYRMERIAARMEADPEFRVKMHARRNRAARNRRARVRAQQGKNTDRGDQSADD